MRKLTWCLAILIILGVALPARAGGPFNIRVPAATSGIDPQAVTVIGAPQHHMTKKGEDLLDVARHYDLGWTEIGSMYRQWDPFLPPPVLPVRNKRYTSGTFEIVPGRTLYINRGLGHLIQVRFNVRPELTLFTLTRAG